MPCDTNLKPNETLAQREVKVNKALSNLESMLSSGRASVRISPTGAVAFEGWKGSDRDDVTDVCAYRTLSARGSFALRTAVSRAETLQGRKVNPHAVAAGHHSHDGGKTWHGGH